MQPWGRREEEQRGTSNSRRSFEVSRVMLCPFRIITFPTCGLNFVTFIRTAGNFLNSILFVS